MSDAGEPTLADVAECAGVSVATASRVLSGTRFVSEDKTKAVRKAITKLGYRHNAVASALRSQRTRTVGVVLPRYSTAFLSDLIESVSAALDGAGVSLVLRYSSADAIGDADTVESLLARRVDGIIICPPSEDISRNVTAAAGRVPIVQVGRYIFGDATDSVGLDDNRATELLVGRLAATGARSVLSVGLSDALPADARRIAALRGSCEIRGIDFAGALETDAVLAGGVAAANRLVADLEERSSLHWGKSNIDTIVCANDDVAHGLMTVLRLHGVVIPEQLQVASLLDVSFSDDESRMVTTLRHPWTAMGREAVRLLLDALEAGTGSDVGARRLTFAPQLLEGESTRGTASRAL